MHSFFNEEPLEEAAAQRSFALLNLLANPDDRVALRWWLCSGSQTGLADQYLKLRIHCQKNGWSPKEALDAILNGRMSIQGIGKLSSKYLELRNAVSELQDLPLEDVIDFVLPEGEDELGELRDIALRAAVDADSVKDLFSTMQAHIT